MLKLRSDPAVALLNLTTALFIVAVYLVASITGLSRVAHLCLALVLFSLLWVGWRSGLKLRLDGVMLLYFGFFLFACASLLWAPYNDRAVEVLGLLVDVVGAVAIWVGLWNGLRLQTIGYAALLGASVQAVLAVEQFYRGDFSPGSELRAEGLTGNANALAIQLSVAALLILISFRRSFWPPLLAVVLVVVATVVSGSRKMAFVWFSLILLLLQYFGVKLRSSNLFRVAFFLVLPPLIYLFISYSSVILAPFEGLYVVERWQAIIEGNTESSARIRAAMIREGLALWQTSPIIGHGIGQFRYLSSFGTYSHNNYVELLVSFGVIGFLLYYGAIFILLLRAGLGLLNKAPYAMLSVAAIILLLLWDVGMVSYSGRLNWIFLGVLGYLSSIPARSEVPRPSAEGLERPRSLVNQRAF